MNLRVRNNSHTIIKVEDKIIGRGRDPFIIAEAGVNHNGKLDLAINLVDAASSAGADAVKFQTFKAEEETIGGVDMVQYQKRNLKKDLTQIEMLRELELKEEFYGPIMKRCRKKGIIFLSTAHGGFRSVDFLNSINVKAFKFGSGEINNYPLLLYAAKFRKPMIISTGMSTMKEVELAIQCVRKAGNGKIIALHCTTNYPCPFEEANLNAMLKMMEDLDVLVGYSDHTLGFEASLTATILGAVVIEKHFTLDRNMKGPDHEASLEPYELKEMVKQIRLVKTIMGSGAKRPTKSELGMKSQVRRSVVSTMMIKKGDRFSKENIEIKRPGIGLEPKCYWELIGKKARKDIQNDSIITKRDYE